MKPVRLLAAEGSFSSVATESIKQPLRICRRTLNTVEQYAALRSSIPTSHRDEALRNELEKRLSLLQRNNFIVGWHDRGIGAGDEWKAQIDDHLLPHIILFLISSDFLASDYRYDIEMKLALERHASGETVVVPIILRDVDWSGSKFSHLQALQKTRPPSPHMAEHR